MSFFLDLAFIVTCGSVKKFGGLNKQTRKKCIKETMIYVVIVRIMMQWLLSEESCAYMTIFLFLLLYIYIYIYILTIMLIYCINGFERKVIIIQYVLWLKISKQYEFSIQ